MAQKLENKSTLTLDIQCSKSNLTNKEDIYDKYDPFENRDKNGNSSIGSMIHLLKCFLGSGMLAMPMAFKNSGTLFGVFGTIIVGLICGHCVHMLVRSSQEVCKKVRKPFLSYADTAEAVFANGPQCVRNSSNFARNFVDGSLMATYWATACVYVLFISTSFHDVINYDLEIDWDKRIYIAIVSVPIILIGQIRNLKFLIPFSASANFLIFMTFGITLYYMFRDPLVYSDKPLYAGYKTLPLFFSTVIFAMEGIGVVMPVENEMRTPKHFLGCPSVLNTVMFIVITFLTIIGFFGYVKYGNNVEGSITLSLPDGAPLADVAKIFMALSIMCTYPLQIYVANDILWKKISYKFEEQYHNIAQIIIRAVIVLGTCGIAAGVPNLEPVIGFVGSVFFSILGIFIPSFIDTVHRWENLGAFKWILIKNIFIMTCAVFALLTGAFVSIMQIITGDNDK